MQATWAGASLTVNGAGIEPVTHEFSERKPE